MSSSEIEKAEAIVAAVTATLDLAYQAGRDELPVILYADEEAFRLAHPAAHRTDNAGHARIARTLARAAHRHGFDIAVHRLRAEPMRAWLAARGEGADLSEYPGEPADRLHGDAALRALGLRAADLRQAPRKPATGRTLAARIARWATDPEAPEDEIEELTEELLAQRLDGALGPLEGMLEPEDFAHARREIDFAAAMALMGEAGEEGLAPVFVSPVMRSGEDPRDSAVPATLAEALMAVAIDPAFAHLVLAPRFIATATMARLRPSDLRDLAEALANGVEPSLPPATPLDRDVCLVGLNLPFLSDEEPPADEEAVARLDRWEALVAEAAGGGEASLPVPLARALDLLRRAKLAIPDDGQEDEDEEEQDGEDPPVKEALLAAIAGHLAGIGQGSALLVGQEDGAVAIGIADGVASLAPEELRAVLADALAEGGILFVAPAGAARGHAFLLEAGEAEGVSAADAAAMFAEEAPADWAAAPAGWQDAPALDYDPGA
ncbi:hypothetical protein [Falsiroseomonas ponticola]|uniref:hypothetical protein n=1 Tax=Falsiroseomonas ponticola TaxID=2786951 RepID=UPI0019338D79|nr:hypothetical protein [Roseomonas ponticola]